MQNLLPEFQNEEQEFWVKEDSTEYLDWSQARHGLFPNLKPSTKTISLRLSQAMLNELKLLASQQDVPYQSLIKVFLRERIDQELYRQQINL